MCYDLLNYSESGKTNNSLNLRGLAWETSVNHEEWGNIIRRISVLDEPCSTMEISRKRTAVGGCREAIGNELQ